MNSTPPSSLHGTSSLDWAQWRPDWYQICETSFANLIGDSHSRLTEETLQQMRQEYDTTVIWAISHYYQLILWNPKLPLRFLRTWLNNAQRFGVNSDVLKEIERELPTLQENELVALLDALHTSWANDHEKFLEILDKMCQNAVENWIPLERVDKIREHFSNPELPQIDEVKLSIQSRASAHVAP